MGRPLAYARGAAPNMRESEIFIRIGKLTAVLRLYIHERGDLKK
jgi:hypothetical protein